MSNKRHHAEWLSLVEVSGPFLTMPVLERVFSSGLDAHDPEHARLLRTAYDEWQENQEGRRPSQAVHNAWIKFVLTQTLELPGEVLAEGQAIPATIKATISEHGETLRPDFLVRNPDDVANPGKSRLLIQTYSAEQNLDRPVAGRHWKASPATRMMELLHSTDVRLGLVTNGEHWMLVDAPRGETTGFASWYAHLWLEEPLTQRAFRSLLGVRRFFGIADDETLEAMLAESATNQQEVTDQLGLQVRHAVEVLIHSLDRADQDHGRELLAGVPETVLYEAALTVMMRLVFLFCAEERELLLLGDPLYDQHYAVSTLAAQLQEAADQLGEEVLERRLDAWVRLLATFRAIYGGVQHERMKLPAYSGNLFNPDRFPFLEGRKAGTSWCNTPTDPLPVDNRTVLHLLRSLQYLEMQGEARRLSFRSLDIEQIGHVYEGLLDHTAERAAEPMLGLLGAKGKDPEITLAELERLRAKGEDDLIEFLHEETGKSENALRNALEASEDGEQDAQGSSRLRAACGNSASLFERVRPFAGVVRDDSFGRPFVIRKGSVYVTEGTDRRSSGTHYTPISLTEPIVRYTLEPLVYIGPAEGKPSNEWKLRPPAELLDLKVCDMACGSGAFLVQACRYLAERLVEAWEDACEQHPDAPGITPFGEVSSGKPGEVLIPKDAEERLIYARRVVAGRCLYGVDKNPLAVEMGKLSLWLLTLAKDKPFTFLDHAIRCGDSLVGISSVDQLLRFSFTENVRTGPLLEQQRQQIENRLNATKMLRRQIEDTPCNTPQDVERKTLMLKNADEQARRLTYAADLLLAASWEPTPDSERESALNSTLIEVEYKFKDLPIGQLDDEAKKRLSKAGVERRFHWPLEFPEVFSERGGFDALVCNPPFMGGQKITGNFGEAYREFLVEHLAHGKRGSADLCAYFFLRAGQMLREGGQFGFLATNTIAQGDTREVGLERLTSDGCTIPRAVASQKWPGTASLEVSQVWLRRGAWVGERLLDGHPVNGITAFLTAEGAINAKPYLLASNQDRVFKGSDVTGLGFLLSHEEAAELIARNAKNRDVVLPFLTGEDLNKYPDQSASRWVINFRGWPLDHDSAPDHAGPVAADYPECLRIVEERVKPQRLTSNDKKYREFWWQFARRRDELYSTISGLDRVLVRAEVANLHSMAIVRNGIVFSNKLCVFAFEDYAAFSLFQSSLHEAWARYYAPTMRTDMSYSVSDCFETFAMASDHAGCAGVGMQYHEHRGRIMLDRQEGLTKTYNRFHDADETAADIQKLRTLHVEMDNAVAAAYGWTDLDLCHGFHETKQGDRFTISESARREVLARLLKLNHERYAEEVAQGLHEPKAKRAAGGKKKSRKGATKIASALVAPTLFDMTAVDTAFPSTDRDRLLCGLLCDLVAAQPGLPSTAYLDAMVIVLRYKRHSRLLVGSEQTQFAALSGKLPKKCVQSDDRLPWTELVELLAQQDAIRRQDGTTLIDGGRLAEVRKAYPNLDQRLIELIHKAAAALREMQGLAKPRSAGEKQALSEFADDVRTLCGASP